MTRSARARSGAEIRLAAAICLLFGARSRGSFIDGYSMPDLIQADSPGSLPRLFRKGFQISAMTKRWTDFRFLPRHIRFASDRSANVRFSDRAPENGRWPGAHQ